MLSGRRPRGNSSTPVSGKIGRMSGSASPGSLMAQSREKPSREHQRRQLAPRRQGKRVGRAHDLEEFDELLACGLVVPGAVLAVERQKLVDALLALAGAEERRRELEARFVVIGVSGKAGAVLVALSHRLLRLLGELKRRMRRGDLGVAELLLWHARQELASGGMLALVRQHPRQPRQRIDIIRLALQDLREDAAGAVGIAGLQRLLRHR